VPEDNDIIALVIAALLGAAVGLERQWSGHADSRFAGLRTFTLLGVIGGVSGLLWTEGVTWPSLLLLAGALMIIGVAYAASSRTDVDATTEVASLVVLAAGLLAGFRSYQIASGIIALTVLLLIEKTRLHTWVTKIDAVGLRAGVLFAAMALVILPLLPEGPYGPFGGIRPRELWALVLFFSGLSFVGYVLQAFVPPGRGYFVTGAVGGLISSTSVTLSFARLSRESESNARELGYGVVAANATLYPRTLLATLVLNATLAPGLLPYLAPPFVIATIVALIGFRSAKKEDGTTPPIKNPLQLRAALQMVVLFQVVLMIAHLAQRYWGASGVLGSAAILGLTDVDAVTATMARGMTGTPAKIATLAIAIGALANTFLKLVLALSIGRGAFRRIAGGTLALMLLGGGTAVLFGLRG
jgi:uncharacterized membrane protein (DUF4010 family)